MTEIYYFIKSWFCQTPNKFRPWSDMELRSSSNSWTDLLTFFNFVIFLKVSLLWRKIHSSIWYNWAVILNYTVNLYLTNSSDTTEYCRVGGHPSCHIRCHRHRGAQSCVNMGLCTAVKYHHQALHTSAAKSGFVDCVSRLRILLDTHIWFQWSAGWACSYMKLLH